MLRYVTGNQGKVREAVAYLGDTVEAVNYNYPELQADTLEKIAAFGAQDAFDELPGDDPVIVDDAGLFIDALGGFPGPYSAYVEERLGIERVADLALAEEHQRARFIAAIGYADGETVETFVGTVRGTIVAPRGDGGFGYDPIFAHRDRTFAEMSTAEKNAVSHRGRALELFADWYQHHQ